MKKNKKIILKTQTVAKLNSESLNAVAGGTNYGGGGGGAVGGFTSYGRGSNVC